MYNNIGQKIKATTIFLFIGGSLAAIIMGLFYAFEEDELFGFWLCSFAPVVLWMLSLSFYGFGELVEKICGDKPNVAEMHTQTSKEETADRKNFISRMDQKIFSNSGQKILNKVTIFLLVAGPLTGIFGFIIWYVFD